VYLLLLGRPRRRRRREAVRRRRLGWGRELFLLLLHRRRRRRVGCVEEAVANVDVVVEVVEVVVVTIVLVDVLNGGDGLAPVEAGVAVGIHDGELALGLGFAGIWVEPWRLGTDAAEVWNGKDRSPSPRTGYGDLDREGSPATHQSCGLPESVSVVVVRRLCTETLD
jgi:hypothetical protein